MSELERLEAERNLYRRLARLGAVEEPGAFLAAVLDLAAEATGAEHGYVQLRNRSQIVSELANGSADPARVRDALSTGVLQRALLEGQLVATDDASADPAWAHRPSVQQKRPEAILCAPIGTPTIGVVYLQGRRGGGPFPERAEQLLADVVECIEPLARQVIRGCEQAQDPTWTWRRALIGSEDLIGRSEALAGALRHVALYAGVDKSVLATGPSGVGKTQLMELVHRNSPRAKRPWVVIDAPSLASGIASSELFGSTRGAFTGAVDRAGAVERAHTGTLFLDEVGELEPDVQTMLLRFLESGEFRRVGESRTRRSDVRVLAATNRDLQAMVAGGAFREDLYYRLAQLELRVPSLAERTEDVLLIAEWQVARFCRGQGWPVPELAPSARRALRDAEWSVGGIRRLVHLMDRAAIHAHADSVPITATHLFPETDRNDPEEASVTWHEATRAFQRRLLAETLEQCGGNVSAAARQLDLDRSYVHRMLRV